MGLHRGLTIENCTDTTACRIITKREYNFGVSFVPSKLLDLGKLLQNIETVLKILGINSKYNRIVQVFSVGT